MALALNTKSICLSVLALLGLVHLCSAAQHTVGESSGWTFGVNYTQWAASKTFQVGDTLLFPYAQGAHNVLEVSRADHDSCTSTNAISTYANANAVVTLSKLGQQWFICGISGHCTAGMELAVNVLASTSSTASPAPAPAPASSSPAPSPRRGLSPRASPAPVSRSPVSEPTPAPISGGVLPPTPSVSDSPVPSPSADQAPTPVSSESPAASPSAEQVPPPPTFTDTPAASPPSSGGLVPPTPASSETPAASPSAEQVPPPPTFTDTPAASPPSSSSPAMSSRLAAAFSSAAVVAAGLAFLM